MLLIRCWVLSLLILALPFGLFARARKGETGFIDRAFSGGATTTNYKVFIPKNWNKKKKWPVILFLHGAGERGSDNAAQTKVGLGPAITRQQDNFPFVVVMPQCPTGRWWSEPEIYAIALRALDKTVKEFNGDKTRLYLTGLSMGGYGTWPIAAQNPDKFAALAVVCGGIRPPARVPIPESAARPNSESDPYKATAQKISKTPVWVFHGAADPVVPVSESRKMVEALKAEGADVRYSEYEGVMHNSWDRAYAEPELFSWMLSHTAKSSQKKR
jgi:predicted peptidase